MIIEMPERLFCPLEILSYPINRNHLKEIELQIFDKKNPNTFYLESNQSIFFIDRVNNKFKIVKRNYVEDEEKNLLIDSYCMIFLRMMKMLKFEVSLENKYCN
jgi:hypothetical protein